MCECTKRAAIAEAEAKIKELNAKRKELISEQNRTESCRGVIDCARGKLQQVYNDLKSGCIVNNGMSIIECGNFSDENSIATQISNFENIENELNERKQELYRMLLTIDEDIASQEEIKNNPPDDDCADCKAKGATKATYAYWTSSYVVGTRAPR